MSKSLVHCVPMNEFTHVHEQIRGLVRIKECGTEQELASGVGSRGKVVQTEPS